MSKQKKGKPEQVFHPDTLWKLVDAKCSEIKDAISSARIPMLLMLLWGFIWFVTLYNHEIGYTKVLIERYQSAISELEPDSSNACEILDSTVMRRYHKHLLNENGIYNDAQNNNCYQVLMEQHKMLLGEQVDSWKTLFPGITADVWIFDLGIIGQIALIILLLWFYFAARRENSAIKGFVDFQNPISEWFPKKFELKPKQDFLSSEHYVYAYNSVTNRFLFVISAKSKSHIVTTMLLLIFPSMVAGWNVFTDVRDTFKHLDFELDALVRSIIGTILFIFVVSITKRVLKKIIETGILLNGWKLSIRDCWEKEWNENDLHPAPTMTVDREGQIAKIAKEEKKAKQNKA